jgi:hypothetical protein
MRCLKLSEKFMAIKPGDPISAQIKAIKKKLDAEGLKNLKAAAIKHNISEDSLIWMLVDVYASGHYRSNSYYDCPVCVVSDGLVEQDSRAGINYLGWKLTEKAKTVLGGKA